MNANILTMPAVMLALMSSSPSIGKPKDEKERSAREHALPTSPGHPSDGPHKLRTQSAKCTGIDKSDRPQSLILESRWLPDGLRGRTVLFVLEDTTGFLKTGSWLENGLYRGDDRKYGIEASDWNGVFFKRVGDRSARISIREHDYDFATVTYVTRPYFAGEDVQPDRGLLSLVGRCRLFVENEPRSDLNRPQIIGPR